MQNEIRIENMMTTAKEEKLGILSAILGNSIFGFSFIFSKMALNTATPFVLLAFRFTITFLVLNLLLLTGKIKCSLKGKPWWRICLLGLFQPVLYFIGENYGILYTSATFSAVMIAMIPIVALFFAALFLHEKITLLQVISCLVSIVGVLMMTIGGSSGTTQLKGFLLLLLAVFSATMFHLLSRSLSGTFNSYERSYVMFLVGMIFFDGAAAFESKFQIQPFTAAIADRQFCIAVLYLSIVSSVIAFLLLNYMNTVLPVSRTSVFANLTTIISVLAGAVFLSEKMTFVSCAAVVLIVSGLWGVQKFAFREKE